MFIMILTNLTVESYAMRVKVSEIEVCAFFSHFAHSLILEQLDSKEV